MGKGEKYIVRNIDDNIYNSGQKIKEFFHTTVFYKWYVRLIIGKKILEIHSLPSVNKFLNQCVENKWISRKSAEKYKEDWIVRSIQEKKKREKEEYEQLGKSV